MEYYEVYQKIGGYPAVVVSYAQEKDLNKCYEQIRKLIDVFISESKRYFTDIMDVNLFEKLFSDCITDNAGKERCWRSHNGIE